MFRLTAAALVLFTVGLSTSCVKQTRAMAFSTPAAKPTVSRSPKSAVQEAMDRQVRNAVYAGEGDAVAQALRLRVMQEPMNLAARLRLVQHYKESGFSDLAAEHLRIAAERFADRADVQVSLAKALRDVKADDSAVKVLRTFLESHQSAEVSSALGVIEDDLGRLGEAEKAHRTAVELEPRRASYLNNLGYNLLLQGKRKEAADKLRAALEIEPRNETARNNLAVALAVDDPREALAHWRSMTDPATAYSNLAAVLMEQGRFAEARTQLIAALSHRKDHPAALRNLALLADADGRAASVPIVRPDYSPRVLAGRLKRALGGKEAPPKKEPVVAAVQ